MRNFTNPYTGRTMDYDAIPVFSRERNQAGRFCPETGKPLDAQALKHYWPSMGDDSMNRKIMDECKSAVAAVEQSLAQGAAIRAIG